MRKCSLLLSACTFTLLGLSSAFAALPAPAFVNAISGSNANAGAGCPITAPCADLNTALSVIGLGGPNVIVIMGGGLFGPIVLNQQVDIIGTEPNEYANILADPTAQVGCVGHLPAVCATLFTNNGYALEFVGGSTDSLTLTHVSVRGGGGSSNALKFGSGSSLKVSYCLFNGGDVSPAVQIYPNTGSPVNVYFAHSQISGGSGTNAGAVEVKPSGSTSVGLHFNHMQVNNASFGIRTDGSTITSGSVVSTFVSNSEFFAIQFAAVNAFSSAGTGTVQATFDTTHILNTGTALKANGPLSSVVLNFNTVTGNGIGIQQQNSATVFTSGNNTVKNNGTNVSGALTASPTL